MLSLRRLIASHGLFLLVFTAAPNSVQSNDLVVETSGVCETVTSSNYYSKVGRGRTRTQTMRCGPNKVLAKAEPCRSSSSKFSFKGSDPVKATINGQSYTVGYACKYKARLSRRSTTLTARGHCVHVNEFDSSRHVCANRSYLPNSNTQVVASANFRKVPLGAKRVLSTNCPPGQITIIPSCKSSSNKFEVRPLSFLSRTAKCEIKSNAVRVSTTITSTFTCTFDEEQN